MHVLWTLMHREHSGFWPSPDQGHQLLTASEPVYQTHISFSSFEMISPCQYETVMAGRDEAGEGDARTSCTPGMLD